jgi:hypothetical protein
VGHRACMAVRSQGRISLFYNHWAAHRLDIGRFTRPADPWCRTALFSDRWHSLENDLGELLRAGPG